MKNSICNRAAEIVLMLKQKGFAAYFVGGCVRDFIRGVEPDDYDIVTSAHPEQVEELFPRTIAVGAKFGVVAVIVDGHPFEVATFRSDDEYLDGRRPSSIRFSDARRDACRRDFTVNGLLMDPETSAIIDYVDGRVDIEKKIIRTIGKPDARFNEDYLRMLRAVRFAANLDFALERETQDAIIANAAMIKKISAERLQQELNKVLTRGHARRGMELLAQTGLLPEVLPEVAALGGIEQPPLYHPEGDVWQHTLIMLDLLPREGHLAGNSALAWAVLLHDAGKALTRTEDEKGVHFYGHVQAGEEIAARILQRLRFSNNDRETVIALIHCHMVFMNAQKMRPGRLKRFLRMPDFNLHLELHRLDCLASHGLLDNYDFCVEQLRHLDKEDLHPQRLLNGNDLMAMGFTQGKIIGEIIAALEEEQLEGRISTPEEASLFVRDKFKN